MMQSYVVYQDGNETVARGRIDGRIVQRAGTTEALQSVLHTLAQQGGGELLIECGVYPVAAPLEVPSMVTVRGSGRATVLKLVPGNTAGVILAARSRESFVITDLTCQGDPDQASATSMGILLDDCGDCEIRNVAARDFGYGVVLRNNSFMNKLLNNTTSGNRGAGTLIKDADKAGRGGQFAPNLIVGCTSLGEAGHGFEIDNALCTNLTGCQVYQPEGHGFYVRNTANSTCLSGSRVFQGMRNGVMVENAHELNVSSNIICWNRGHGIELNNVVWGTVSANDFIDNGGQREPRRYGIYMHTDTKFIQVTANALFNWQGHRPMISGIYEAEDCQYNQISDNTVNHYTETAATALGQESVARHNLGYGGQIPWPRDAPFPTEPLGVSPGAGFSREELQAFLALLRR